MKRIISLFVVFIVLLCLASCGSGANSETDQTQSAGSDVSTGKIGNYSVSVKDAKIVSTNDDDVLIVTYSFTNNGKDAKSFLYAVSDKLYQNGTELDTLLTSWGIEDEYDFNNRSKEIQPGVTLDVQCAYKLIDSVSPVTVDASEWLSFSNKKITFTISLDGTTSVSDGTVVAKKIDNIVVDGKIGEYVVTLKKSKVVVNNGKNILIVTYSFTNNAKEAKAFTYAVSDKLYQNGVELGTVYSSWGIEDEYDFHNKSKEIQPGITLDVQCAYELNDETTDVTVEISDWLGLTSKKAVYTINIGK